MKAESSIYVTSSKKECVQVFLDWMRTLVLFACFLSAQSDARIKPSARKNGLDKINLSRSTIGLDVVYQVLILT